GSELYHCFQHVSARPFSSLRTCQQHVLPLKKHTLPPFAMNASRLSRIGVDQYSSWPTLSTSLYACKISGRNSKSLLTANSRGMPFSSHHATNGCSQVLNCDRGGRSNDTRCPCNLFRAWNAYKLWPPQLL